jgi:hypothetical protein
MGSYIRDPVYVAGHGSGPENPGGLSSVVCGKSTGPGKKHIPGPSLVKNFIGGGW